MTSQGVYFCQQGTKITTDGSNQMLADLNFNSNNIINVAMATATHHAVPNTN